MSPSRILLGWIAAAAMLFIKATSRLRLHDDPRPGLRSAGRPYAYAILHGHQLGAVIAAEPGTGAMVSRSADGEILIPCLRVRGVVPVRGSTRLRGAGKGGASALEELLEHVRRGRPAYFAVDGPRGPRGYVNRGVARLALETGAAIVLAVPVARRRWILTGAWDRFQIPKPFTRIDVYFRMLEAATGESLEALRQRVEDALADLEQRHDPVEAEAGREAAARRRERQARETAADADCGG